MAKQRSINPALPWQQLAGKLAAWTQKHLLNRDDIWTLYLPPSRRRDGVDAVVVPKPSKRGKTRLTTSMLAEHYASNRVDRLIGVHGSGDSDQSRFLRFDVYKHGEADGSRPGDNFQAALDWAEDLEKSGLSPLVMESRAGAYSVLVIFEDTAPTQTIYEATHDLVSDYGHRGLFHEPDVWPNWPAEPIDDLINFMPLPGRHPTTDDFTRVWDGNQWMEGVPAIEALLTMQHSPPWRAGQSKKPKLEVMEMQGRSESGSAVYVEHRQVMPERKRVLDKQEHEEKPAPPAPKAIKWAAETSGAQPAARSIYDAVPAAPGSSPSPTDDPGVAEPPTGAEQAPPVLDTPEEQAPAPLAYAPVPPPAGMTPPPPAGDTASESIGNTAELLSMLAEEVNQAPPAPIQETGDAGSPHATLQTAPSADFGTEARLQAILTTLRGLTSLHTDGGSASGDHPQDAVMDPDLRQLIDTWPHLPAPVRAGIMAMVRSAAA